MELIFLKIVNINYIIIERKLQRDDSSFSQFFSRRLQCLMDNDFDFCILPKGWHADRNTVPVKVDLTRKSRRFVSNFGEDEKARGRVGRERGGWRRGARYSVDILKNDQPFGLQPFYGFHLCRRAFEFLLTSTGNNSHSQLQPRWKTDGGRYNSAILWIIVSDTSHCHVRLVNERRIRFKNPATTG